MPCRRKRPMPSRSDHLVSGDGFDAPRLPGHGRAPAGRGGSLQSPAVRLRVTFILSIVRLSLCSRPHRYDVDFSALIGRGLRDLGVDVRGKRVFLKPNMVEYEAGTAINTDPLVVVGAAVAVPPRRRRRRRRRRRSRPSARHRVPARQHGALRSSAGRAHPLRRSQSGRCAGGGVEEPLHRAREAVACRSSCSPSDFIVSMPKLKTHHWAGMTASMKNFFGTVPGAVYGWPKNILHVHGIDASILDLNATIQPAPGDRRRRDGHGRRRPDHGEAAARWIRRNVARSRLARRDSRPRDRPGSGAIGLPGRGRAVSGKSRRTTHRAARRACCPVCHDLRRRGRVQVGTIESGVRQKLEARS